MSLRKGGLNGFGTKLINSKELGKTVELSTRPANIWLILTM